ncbi:mannitol dehydrogenase family protein [Arthrobacter gyeryongensis]|uniref:Mannitol-1-phosphate 5-dehydrogenase n=1 Tax=Arthrobacter gyeryongensis TaxID=1650592 RepID=A0ABP9SVR1_9MICC
METQQRAQRTLNAQTFPLPKRPPIRIVHLGLGAFHRAHEAWYTWKADSEAEWGIACFTGRSPAAATALASQDGLYTLIERSATGDTFQVVSSIVEARDGSELARLRELLRAETTAVVTLTITEAGYHLLPNGALDLDQPAVAADIQALRQSEDLPDNGGPSTPIGRLVLGLGDRMSARAGEIAIVCCDNLADNAAATRNAVFGLAQAADPPLASWIAENVSFVGTSVDRITPRTTDADLDIVREYLGLEDHSPVVTEPFTNWILSGSFPMGRPAWEDAGAVFVENLEPYENRKLWLLNGAHSLLAYTGLQRGHTTVAEALLDPYCSRWVQEFWDEAERNLPSKELQISAYRAALLERFSNKRISHQLSQIAADGTHKLRMRALPVIQAELSAGRPATGAMRVISAWLGWVQGAETIQDPAIEAIRAALQQDGRKRTESLTATIDQQLAQDPSALELIEKLAGSVRS